MKVTRYTGGPLPTNCYMLTDESTGASAVIDPGFVNASLLKAVEEADVQAILLTHGHWDHIAGVAEIQKKTGAKLYIDAEDELFLTDSALNLSVELTGRPLPPLKANVTVSDGDVIPLGNLRIHVLHTPGHTIGSCCYVVEGAIFSGDTLFKMSAGRTDFPTGSYPQLLASLKRLCALEGDYHVYPGHEWETTLGFERKHNPFVEG